MFSILSRRLANSIHSVNYSVLMPKTGGASFVMSKKKASGKTSMNLSAKVQVSILGNGALGNPASVIVNTDTETYLINCGEGVQRLFYQHKIRISKIKDVFLTRVAHSNYAGIFGMFLTYDSYFNERGNVPILHTPPGMKEISQIYSPFIGLVKNFQYRFIGDQSSEENGQVVERKSVPECETLLESVDMAIKSIPIFSSINNNDTSVAYIFLVTDKPGPVMIEKCKSLKLPPGPWMGKIKNGEEVEVNGRIIKPDDVLGPKELGGAFVVLECATIESVESLINNGTFAEHLQSKALKFVIHITPEDVFQTEQYQSWLQTFEPEVKHFVVNSENRCEISLNDSSYVQAKLNHVDNEIFPALKENHVDKIDLLGRIVKNIPTMFTFNLRPEKTERFEFAQENSSFEIKDVVKPLKDIQNLEGQIQEYRDSCVVNPTADFEQNILFLGTGSSIPGKLRNTSAIFLNIREDSTAILDCGESTFNQLCRFYGRDHYRKVLESVSLIYVSHLHADHHFGMLEILQEISKTITAHKTILVVAPEEIYTFLEHFPHRYDKVSIEFAPVHGFSPALEPHAYSEFLDSDFYHLQKKIGIEKIVTVPVPHSYSSHGIVLDLGEGKRIAYSGDSQFSNAFDEVAKDCLLMIHEATMDDDLRLEADMKRHSTISDAISVARNCNAQYTILTHFSQRYAKIPLVNSQSDAELNRYISDNVGIAFDFMNIKLSQLQKAGKLKIPLETLFANDLQDIQDKQAKKAQKRKLIEEEEARLQVESEAKESVVNTA